MDREGPVVVLTMNRPARRNAMTLAMFGRLADAWDEIDADETIRACILTGAGDHFCAGMDLRAMAGDADATDDYDVAGRMERDGSGWIYDGLLKTRHPRVPIIAAVEGNAIAGGTEILQGTEIRVAGEGRPLEYPRPGGPCTRVGDRPFDWPVRFPLPKRLTAS